ncbi:tetratricopeptide repeat protein [Cytophagaceae bacterium ABcell3]|nr:tetratricopeptide repeat protein [Cytophagaceae bacterium ABcell3]
MSKNIIYIFLCLLLAQGLSAQNTMIRTADDLDFRRGIELLDNKKYAAAREFFERFYAQNPHGLMAADAEYYIAYSAMNLFHPDAEILFQAFLERYPWHARASEAYFDLGTFYYNNKSYDKAIEYLEKVNFSQMDREKSSEGKFMLGYSFFTKKKFDQALETFDGIKSTNHKYTYAANYYAGYINYRNEDYEQALTDLKVAERNDSYKNIVPSLLVNIYYKQGDYDQLLSYISKLEKKDGDLQNAGEIYLIAGEAWFMKKDYQKAAEFFNKHINSVRGKPAPEVLYRMAFSAFKNESYEEAIDNFKLVAGQKDSIGQNAGYYLGVSYVKTDNKTFALAAFDQARKLSYNKEIQEEAYFQYAKINYELGKFSDAIHVLKSFTKTYPDSEHAGEASELMSESLLKSNNYDEAIKYIEGLKSRTPKVNAAYQRIAFYKGVDEFNRSKFREAIKSFEKSLQHKIDNELVIAAYFWHGEALSVMREYEAAINSYAAVFRSPDYEKTGFGTKARYSIGYAYYNTQQYEKALPHFREYVSRLRKAENKLNYIDALVRLADLYYVSKNYEDALKYYDEAIDRKSPDTDYAWYQKGLVYSLNDKPTKAKKSFSTVIDDHPTSLYLADAVFQRAQLNFRENNYEDAISGFTTIVEEHVGSVYVPFAYLRRALAYSNLQEHKKALQDYEVIVEKFPKHEVAQEALRGLPQPLAALGRGEEVSAYIEQIKESNPDVNTEGIEYDAAYNLYSHDKYPKAIEAFRKYLETYPEGGNVYDAKFFLAESFYYNNEKEEGKDYYKSVAKQRGGMYYNRALSRLYTIALSAGELKEAKNYLQLLLPVAKNKKERANAWTGLMELYYKLDKLDSSAHFANQVLRHGGGTIDSETKAMLHLGKVAYAKKEYTEAKDHFVSTVNTARDASAVEAQYLIAKIQYELEKYKQSLETLYELNKSFPANDEWLGKSFLLISDNLIALDEIFQAKATLNSIIERSPHQETVNKAKERLKELEEEEASEKNIETTNE